MTHFTPVSVLPSPQIKSRRNSWTWPNFVPVVYDAWMAVEFWRMMIDGAPACLVEGYKMKLLQAESCLPPEDFDQDVQRTIKSFYGCKVATYQSIYERPSEATRR